MKFILSVSLFIVSTSLFAQQWIVNVRYYDVYDQEVAKEDKWYTYQVDSILGDQFRTSAYYADKKMRFSQERESAKDRMSRTYYYQTGEVMAKGILKNGWFVGSVSFYRPDGSEFAEVSYPDETPRYGEQSRIRILEYTDSLGNRLITKGKGSGMLTFPCIIDDGEGKVVKGNREGTWKGNYKDGSFEDLYKDGLIVEGSYATHDGTIYRYKKITELPEPVGGMEVVYKHVGKVMKYPSHARRTGIQGTVFIEFNVNADGSTSDIRTIKGIDPECDAEALNAVRTTPPWKAGRYRGEPKKMRMILPVKFVLG